MAHKNESTIKINGRTYDATSGMLVVDQKAEVSQPTASVTKAQVMDVKRPTASHTSPHKPQHGHTLMRRALKKPKPGLKSQVNVTTHTGLLATVPDTSVVPKLSFEQVDSKRLARAERVAKSKLVRRFAPLGSTAWSATAPAVAIPLSAAPPAQSERPTSSPEHEQPGSRSMDIFQKALKHANAHEELPVNPKKLAKQQSARSTHRKSRKGIRHHTLTVASSALAIVLLVGFIAYQNKANLTLRVATASSGVHASLPGYRPDGFAVGKFNYTAGSVAINFPNHTTGSSYSISQKKSSWDSQTLLDTSVAVNNNTYQTLDSAGRTIYVYGNNNATWVDSGILYQITSNGSLSTSQLLDIAQSM